MKMQPLPFQNELVSGKHLSTTWQTVFRNISQNLVQSTSVSQPPKKNYSYALNGNHLTIIYQGNGGETLSLPYASALTQHLQYFSGDGSTTGIININSGDTSINLPEMSLKINSQIIIEQVNR